MSILADSEIARRMDTETAAGKLVIRPMMPNALQPASVDVRLGPVIKVERRYGPKRHDDHNLLDDGPYLLWPDHFVLAATLEWVEIPTDLVGILVGKSTLARLGLCVEDAGYIDPGFRGNVTCEIDVRAARPVELTVGMPIAQIRFEPLMGRCLRPYGSVGVGSHYQDSAGVVPARLGAGS